MNALKGILVTCLILGTTNAFGEEEKLHGVTEQQFGIMQDGYKAWGCAHVAEVLGDMQQSNFMFDYGIKRLRGLTNLRHTGIIDHNVLKEVFGDNFDDLYPINTLDFDLGMQWGLLVLQNEEQWVSQHESSTITEEIAIRVGATEKSFRLDCPGFYERAKADQAGKPAP